MTTARAPDPPSAIATEGRLCSCAVDMWRALLVGVVSALIALSLNDVVLVAWIFAQLTRATWPWQSTLAMRAETWAWLRWDASRRGGNVAAEPVTELSLDSMTPLPSLQRPFVVRGLLNGSDAGPSSVLQGYEWLTSSPIGDLEVDYFSNASVVDGIVPDARAPLRTVVQGILAGSSAKIGTQKIFHAFPKLLDELQLPARVGALLGGNEVVAPSRVGLRLTVPVFMARGAPHARTDLHCEPIGNLALQLGGRKRWTLVPPDESQQVRPSLSKDGRAYFQSHVPPHEPPEYALAHVRRHTVETATGDALWVPTWTWHRVDYLEGETALSASLFHPRREQIVAHNPLFAALVLPNMLKELVGWKMQ